MKVLLFSVLSFLMTAQLALANEGSKGNSQDNDSVRVVREVR